MIAPCRKVLIHGPLLGVIGALSVRLYVSTRARVCPGERGRERWETDPPGVFAQLCGSPPFRNQIPEKRFGFFTILPFPLKNSSPVAESPFLLGVD